MCLIDKAKKVVVYTNAKIIPKNENLECLKNSKVVVDISNYALKLAIGKDKIKYVRHKAQNKFNYRNKYFDLVISIGTLHNLEIFDVKKSINEISRISKSSYIMVESYKNDLELFNLQCWALTCESFFSKNEWEWIFKILKFKGDFEFIYFK